MVGEGVADFPSQSIEPDVSISWFRADLPTISRPRINLFYFTKNGGESQEGRGR